MSDVKERRTTCAHCGDPIGQPTGRGRPRLYCSGQCRGRAYTGRALGVTYLEVAERWGWDCYLCGEAVDIREDDFGRRMAFDHVIPRALGGEDSVENLRIVHYECNLRKGPRPVCPHCLKPI